MNNHVSSLDTQKIEILASELDVSSSLLKKKLFSVFEESKQTNGESVMVKQKAGSKLSNCQLDWVH